MRAEGVFCIKKNLRTHIFFWVWRFSPNSGSKSPTHFFRKKNRNLKNTHTQRLSLENFPNSRVEFGDFPELRFKRNKIPKTCFFSQTKMSLENSPNSRVEFGEFCKLKCWVWRILQIQNQKKKFSIFFKKMHLEKSQEFHLKKKPEFWEFSKLRFKWFIFWVWRILQTQPLSLEKSPNSFFSAKQWIEKKPKLKLRGWVWRILQIRVQSLRTHSFLKKIQTQRLSSENSPNSMVENSPNSGFFQKHPRP
jgi:hypothetical protein